VRKLLLVPALALAATAALAAPAGAGNQRAARRSGVNVVLPAGWHVVRGQISEVTDPLPRAVATFHVRLARHSCECGMPDVAHFPRAGALLVVWEYGRISQRDLHSFPVFARHFRSGRSEMKDACAPGDSRDFRLGGRAFQVEIYLGPKAPASVRAQIAAILNSWQVAPLGRVSSEAP
jgi:hypothetical protein